MILRDTLLSVLGDQVPPLGGNREIRREISALIPEQSSQVIVLTGMRRTGKSTLLGQLRDNAPSGLYVNFEDTRLAGLEATDLPRLLEASLQLAPGDAPFFFDEIQVLPGWEHFIRSLHDRGRRVIVTGSNASLLSRELGTKLTGRHLSFEIFPFSYGEYLAYTGEKEHAESLSSYLEIGGFPLMLRERSPQILRELLQDTILRDVVSRHHLRETRHLMKLVLFLLANSGQPFSFQSLTKNLAMPSVSGTARLAEYLADAYLLLPVQKFSNSFKKRSISPTKFYPIDPGLRQANTPQSTPDIGRRLENAVYIELRRRRHPIWYASERDRWECDFITDEHAIQVCLRLTPENTLRELFGLRGALTQAPDRRPIILTLDQEDVLDLDGVKVPVIPAWQWFMDREALNKSALS